MTKLHGIFGSVLFSFFCVLSALLAVAQAPALSEADAPAPLAQQMRGRWSNPSSGHSNLIEVEVSEQSAPSNAKIVISVYPYCKKVATVMSNNKGIWSIGPFECGNTKAMLAQVRPVTDKKRLDGFYGLESDGKSFDLEWK